MRHDHFKYIFYNIKYQFSFSISSAFILLRIMEKLNALFSKVMNKVMLFILSISLLIWSPVLCVHPLPWGFPGGSDGKESAYNAACSARDSGSIPGPGRSPGEGNATHSSIVAWEIPCSVEPGRLQSMGSQSQTGLIN